MNKKTMELTKPTHKKKAIWDKHSWMHFPSCQVQRAMKQANEDSLSVSSYRQFAFDGHAKTVKTQVEQKKVRFH